MHEHKVVRRSKPSAWTRCVVGSRGCERAHGWVTYVEYCSCGAKRMVEATLARTAKGKWQN